MDTKANPTFLLKPFHTKVQWLSHEFETVLSKKRRTHEEEGNLKMERKQKHVPEAIMIYLNKKKILLSIMEVS